MPFSFPIGRLETRQLIDRAVFNVSNKLPTQYRFGYMGDLTGDDITIRQTSVSVHGLNDESEDDADRIRTLAVAQSRPAVCQDSGAHKAHETDHDRPKLKETRQKVPKPSDF